MAYYRVCSNCGSNLDPGERCDCEREQKNLVSLEGREELIYRQPVTMAKKEHFVKKQSTHSSHKSIVIGFVS